MSKQVAKKRSTIQGRSLLTPPAEFDNKKYSGRWVSVARLNARSDGFEARGFQPYKNKDGNMIKVGDLVWCYMSKADALEHKQALYEAARESIHGQADREKAETDRLSFEIERAGGKLETKISIE